jgi:hypothetical protein
MIGGGSLGNYRSPWRGGNHKVEIVCSCSTGQHTLVWEGQSCSRGGAVEAMCSYVHKHDIGAQTSQSGAILNTPMIFVTSQRRENRYNRIPIFVF